MVNLKDNVWIEGFDRGIDIAYYELAEAIGGGIKGHIYKGKVSDIPEEIAKECVQPEGLVKGTQLDDGVIVDEDTLFGYKNYKEGFGVSEYKTAKESIQSACNQEYCIIFKK